jgi:general secretion pathway protein J
LEADLGQAVARTYRHGQGTRLAALGSDSQNSFLAFVSGGKSNLNNAPRSNLQRVHYQWVDGQISRLHHEMTDGGAISEPAPLLKDIANLVVRYRDRQGRWSDAWRTERLSDLPRAVELKFEQKGRVSRHLFFVGTGYL